ncbi:MAG: HAD family hydrolase [Candidatus Cloacimonetes bacterium]|nr:HAD family hydrolase [Candidatus Cloacimonadota bacterium]
MDKQFPVKGVIFDLDGTLLDTLQDIQAALNKSLIFFKYNPVTLEQTRMMIGEGLDVFIQKALQDRPHTAKDTLQFTAQFVENYEQVWRETTHPYPGILHLVQTCITKRMKLAVLTNKPHDFTKRMLRYFFRGSLVNLRNNPFQFYRGYLDGESVKPDPDGALDLAAKLKLPPINILLVGDSNIDIQTAKNAGMISCGALWGYRSEQEIKDAAPDCICATPSELANKLLSVRCVI